MKAAEKHWENLIAAAEGIQQCADALKKSTRSRDGYDMEKALGWHRIEKMRVHLQGLRLHCAAHGISLVSKAEAERRDGEPHGSQPNVCDGVRGNAPSPVSTWETGRPFVSEPVVAAEQPYSQIPVPVMGFKAPELNVDLRNAHDPVPLHVSTIDKVIEQEDDGHTD